MLCAGPCISITDLLLYHCYNLITQVATLALRLEDELRVRGKGMHNRLSIRRYSVSTRAYILIVVQELGLQQVKRGWSPIRHTMCYLVARHNGQWNIRGR